MNKYNYSMRTFNKVIDKVSHVLGIIVTCVFVFFVFVQLVIQIVQ